MFCWGFRGQGFRVVGFGGLRLHLRPVGDEASGPLNATPRPTPRSPSPRPQTVSLSTAPKNSKRTSNPTVDDRNPAVPYGP